MNTKQLLIFALPLLLTGCSRSQGEFTSGDQKLVPLYAELILVREAFRQVPPRLDSVSYHNKINEILTKGGVTQEELSGRLAELAQHQESFQRFQTLVRQELEKIKPR